MNEKHSKESSFLEGTAKTNADKVSTEKTNRETKAFPSDFEPSSFAEEKEETGEAGKKTKDPNRLRSIFTLALLYGICASLGLASIVIPDQSVSRRERRRLRSFPPLSVQSVLSGQFGSSFEAYALDQIPVRDALLDLRSFSSRYLFWNQDDGGIVSWQSSLIKLERENKNSLDYAVKVFTGVYEKYLKNTDCHIYLSIIPDKAYFLEDPSLVLLDYDDFLAAAQEKLDFAKYIDIRQGLSLQDYYASDSHWKQEKLLETAHTLCDAMGVNMVQTYQQLTALPSFSGVYAGQTAWPAARDALRYLYNPLMDDWSVYSYEKGREIPLYDLEALDSLDPYGMFAGGSTGLVRIDNPHAASNKTLIVFRDSFGSSLAPLLASAYEHVYLVDIRYIPSAQIGRYLDFTDQDVLFLYSTSVLNNATTLK